MSVAGPTPKADLSTPEQEDKRYQAFIDALDLRDQLRDCDLWPPGSDFSKACSCRECGEKIKELKDFEKQIKANKKLITKYIVQVDDKVDLCLHIASNSHWTKWMLDLLHKNLKAKAVSEKSGVPLTLTRSGSAAKLEAIHQNIVQMLRDNGLIGKPEDEEKVHDDDDDNESCDVLKEIDTGRFYYDQTKAKDKAYVLLQEIEKLENDHEKDKKIAEAQQKSLDPAVSMKYIEKQFELVKALPVEELQEEIEELIAEICPRDAHQKMYEKARNYISNTCYAIISKRKEFWQGSLPLASEGNDHSSNGLNETLDSLIDRVNLFEDQWKKDYAPFFNPHDRSDLKRQRAE
ncbi:hypothetical protein PHJA_002929900 [Phtheirospermum japonicum]|uniref:Uncharacterized protein n=1 Tax=Phtheirospermum japonicum TaxID=374723 RepID=A0A830DDS0_9LAMI|nr:hypothetical protein PHJA_002929900 [Phtheirospermum japonicum]